MTEPAFLDLADPAFDVTSAAVIEAREQDWYARTPYGWAILRYEQGTAVLKDRRFQQGNARWPAQNGVHDGPFVQWWGETLLSLEGEDHLRQRRLLSPAFRSRAIEAMRPQFQQLAGELIDAFAPRGRVEFVSEFAEPYAARVLCLLLGLPEDGVGAGRALGRRPRQVVRHQPAPGPAADRGGTRGADRRTSRRWSPTAGPVRATTWSAPWSPPSDDEALSQRELVVGLVFLAFAGMETTRNQLGLALQTFLRHPDQWALLGERQELGGPAVEEIMRVNPTVTWVTREAIEDVDLFGLAIPAGRHRAGALARVRHRPASHGRPTRRSTSPRPTVRRTAGSAAASTTASDTSSPAPT